MKTWLPILPLAFRNEKKKVSWKEKCNLCNNPHNKIIEMSKKYSVIHTFPQLTPSTMR